jgi:hypothetical protein
MNNQARTIIAFVAGAAVGAAVTYLLTSDKGGDAVDEFRRMANKLKEELNEKLGKRRPGMGPSPSTATGQAEDMMGV